MPAKQRRPATRVSARKSAAVTGHFDGDVELYDAFAASCAAQFRLDVPAGQAACNAGDMETLRTLAHNLKSALQMLGHAELCALAERVEAHASAGDLNAASIFWRALRLRLTALTTH